VASARLALCVNAGGVRSGVHVFVTADTVSVVPRCGKVPQVPVSALRVSTAMRRRPDWREERVVIPTALRPL